jgi:DNA-binding CsgD family transcriptional regulator
MIGSCRTAAEHFAERRAHIAPELELADIGAVLIAAFRGDAGEARSTAAIAIGNATEHRQGRKLGYIDYALSVLELGLGNYEQAVRYAQQACRENLLLLNAVLLPDLIEAATHSGDLDAARDALHRYELIATATKTPLVLALVGRCRALLAEPPLAEDLFVGAITELQLLDAPGQVARTRLLYGEWLRRQRRRRDARVQLRDAYEQFLDDGQGGFAERARIELHATGETARARTVGAAHQLTPQEIEVARIAATGSTNREIAEQLFISDSTVDYHLGKVYRKLGVSSRRDLRKALVD